ncbi:extracellular solute-binding protein [Marivivens aquimaris]|uniref:extracellular solute-binding protein n=1 Tax=Marivivens aquimaris TaxID=2774876 RepID=UPI0038994DDD
MNVQLNKKLRYGIAVAALFAAAGMANAEQKHAIAMYGDPALEEGFISLPYANPDAPKGGSMATAEVGSFTTLNPFVDTGRSPWQLPYLMGESLMGRSLDEPFSLYGLLAESIETGPNREWVEFTLNPAAEFSDGSPVTVEDVIWSFETLGTEGHGRYRGFWAKVEKIEQTGDRSVRLTFNTEDRELALLAGLRPILQKSQFEGVDFAEEAPDMIPVTSSPYVITDYELGRFIEFTRNPDYWGADVPFRKGTNNFDTLRIEFFGDEAPAFEAFKTGEVNFTREFNEARWMSQYDFPRAQDGSVKKDELQHERPSGMTGFVMNTRSAPFDDWHVRDAMIDIFNFEFINETMTGGTQPRITSYYSNSPLGMSTGPAEGRVLEFLEPYADDLLPGAIEGYELPVSDGSERNRAGTGEALAALEEAGYTIQDGVMKNEAGEPLEFEILLQTGASEFQSIADMFIQSLDRVGIKATVDAVDSAQYKERTDNFDFDMTYYRRGLSLSPGNEQYGYYGSEYADTVGSRNLMGVKSEAVDAMINQMLTSESQSDFVAAVKAMDRALTAGRYVIPTYQWNISRIAYDANLRYPEDIPIFGDWPGWQPDVWWYED